MIFGQGVGNCECRVRGFLENLLVIIFLHDIVRMLSNSFWFTQ